MKQSYTLEERPLIKVEEWTPAVYLEPFHWHSCLEVGYCLKGRGSFFFGQKEFQVRPGDVFVVNNIERHIAQANEEDPCRFIFLYFDPSVITRMDSELLLPFLYQSNEFNNRIDFDSYEADDIRMMVDHIYEEINGKHRAYQHIIKADVFKICASLLRFYNHKSSFHNRKQKLELYHKIQPALTYIQNNFHHPVSLDDVAREIRLSTSRTRHLFKEALGEGFKEHLTHIRINEAKKLLMSTDLSITEIYLNCGFQSHAPFYRMFNQLMGIAPQAYREQMSLNIISENPSYEIRQISI